jgi:hypothetical protein
MRTADERIVANAYRANLSFKYDRALQDRVAAYHDAVFGCTCPDIQIESRPEQGAWPNPCTGGRALKTPSKLPYQPQHADYLFMSLLSFCQTCL